MRHEQQGTFAARHLLVAAWLILAWPVAATAQTIEEFSFNTPVFTLTAGPDGAVWFTEQGATKIGRITTAGAITAFAVPTANSQPSGIVTGPDGNLWFTELNAGANKIGRMTTSGMFAEFGIPTAGSAPFFITNGPDGALWFTEFNGNKIGRITTAGAITNEFPIPTSSAFPYGITAGPDGALWFVESGSGKIGRVTTTGQFAEYTLAAGSDARDIAAGSDGALWFTEEGTNKIGRITTSGSITEFSVLTANIDPDFIAAGPDGALWFTEALGTKVGQITTSGTITEFATPTASSNPTAIAIGPNNAMWFIESAGPKIATFETAVLTVVESGAGAGQVTSNVPVASGQINCSASSNQCSLTYMTGLPITLTASAGANSTFAGWSGGGCSGTAPCTVTLSGNTTVTASFSQVPSFTLSVSPAGNGSGMVTSNPSGINCGTTCNANFFSGTQITLTATAASGSTFAGWSGGGCSGVACSVTISANTTLTPTFIQDATTNIALAAAVLPLSRSAVVGGTPATAFATIINAGPGDALACAISPATVIPASFVFQTTDPATNALSGTPNTPVNIAQGNSQSFVVAFTPNAAFVPINVNFTFGCANASPAPGIVGVNTLDLTASTTPVPDVVALAASGDPGYVDIPGATGTGVFAVATVNLGIDATITAAANTGTANLPVTLTICQTNPMSGACLAAPASSVAADIQPNATPTFGIFVAGSAAVANSPGVNRVFVTFTDSGGTLRGETSVAVRTQ
jgi:virginiamycin B lyase